MAGLENKSLEVGLKCNMAKSLLSKLLGMSKAKKLGGRRDRHKRKKRIAVAKKKYGGFPF